MFLGFQRASVQGFSSQIQPSTVDKGLQSLFPQEFRRARHKRVRGLGIYFLQSQGEDG